MIDLLTIESEGISFFSITADGQEFILDRDTDGGAWHLSWEKGGRRTWIAHSKLAWPEALARALNQVGLQLAALAGETGH